MDAAGRTRLTRWCSENRQSWVVLCDTHVSHVTRDLQGRMMNVADEILPSSVGRCAVCAVLRGLDLTPSEQAVLSAESFKRKTR